MEQLVDVEAYIPPKISVILPLMVNHEWQKVMTEACIRTMRCTTNIPYELVIVEAGSRHFKSMADIHISGKSTYSKEFNSGIDKASGDFIVHIANDIFTKPAWLEALMVCFTIPDCGAATLAASDLMQEVRPAIMEGVYTPLMMFPREYRFDEELFPDIFSDTDLIMRIYESGKRMYRNWNVKITHLYQQTYSTKYDDKEREQMFDEAKGRFMNKHKNSHLLMYRILTEGTVV